MSEILRSLLVPLGILLALGALFVIVQVTAAVRVGETAAMSRLGRWRRLPEAVLRLSTAPNVEAALSGMTAALADGLGARGSLALIRRSADGIEGGRLGVAAAEGTLQGRTDREILAGVLAAPELARLAKRAEEEDVVQLPVEKLPEAFRRAFAGVGRGRLLAVRLRLERGDGESSGAGLILLHISGGMRLDRFNLEVVEAAVRQFPRVVEAVTARFAQAEVLEGLLEEARVKDRLLRMLLGSFQHDLGNTLASLQAGLVQAWETKEASEESADAEFAELYRTIQLAANVARSGGALVEIAEGRSPTVIVEPQDPAELFEQVVRPFLSLRAQRRSDLVLETEIPRGLPAIYVDRVGFFRALSNVLHNAYKYTREGGVRVRCATESDLVVFAVSDTGPGIPSEELPSIGTYRFRASPAAGVIGEGVGLWVTRRLLEAMGGTFRVESEVGVGSTFYLGFAASPARLDLKQVQVRTE